MCTVNQISTFHHAFMQVLFRELGTQCKAHTSETHTVLSHCPEIFISLTHYKYMVTGNLGKCFGIVSSWQ